MTNVIGYVGQYRTNGNTIRVGSLITDSRTSIETAGNVWVPFGEKQIKIRQIGANLVGTSGFVSVTDEAIARAQEYNAIKPFKGAKEAASFLFEESLAIAKEKPEHSSYDYVVLGIGQEGVPKLIGKGEKGGLEDRINISRGSGKEYFNDYLAGLDKNKENFSLPVNSALALAISYEASVYAADRDDSVSKRFQFGFVTQSPIESRISMLYPPEIEMGQKEKDRYLKIAAGFSLEKLRFNPPGIIDLEVRRITKILPDFYEAFVDSIRNYSAVRGAKNQEENESMLRVSSGIEAITRGGERALAQYLQRYGKAPRNSAAIIKKTDGNDDANAKSAKLAA